MNEIISEHELHVFFSSLWLIISFLYCGIVTQWHCVGNIKPYIHNGRCFRHNAIQIRRYGIMSETTSIMDICRVLPKRVTVRLRYLRYM